MSGSLEESDKRMESSLLKQGNEVLRDMQMLGEVDCVAQ